MNTKHYIHRLIVFYRSPQQQQVFQNYLTKSRRIRLIHAAYRLLSKLGLGHIALALQGAISTAQFYPKRPVKGVLIALALSPNQERNIRYIAEISQGIIDPAFMPESKKRGQRIGNFILFLLSILRPGGISSLRKILSIIHKVDRHYGWVVALNIAMYLFNYIAFRRAILSDAKVAFTANDFSPIPLAFKAATREKGLRQLFTMHGQISCSASGNLFPQLDYDISFLYGKKSLDAYEAGNRKAKGKVIFSGFPGANTVIRPVIINSSKPIGIVLPNYYDSDTHGMILTLSSIYPNRKIMLRKHPQMARVPQFRECCRVEIARHKDIQTFGSECDFILAGNTGAQIDLLKSGCPIIYCNGLDKLGYDDIGLVRAEVIPEQKDMPLERDFINLFFGKNWPKKFRSYDASYLISDKERKEISLDISESYRALIE